MAMRPYAAAAFAVSVATLSAVSVLLAGRDTLASSDSVFETWNADRTGIRWRHDNALSGRRYLPESMGPGVAIFDFDNDGWMDLFFTNSGPCDFFTPAKPLHSALYRNQHDGTFAEVTDRAKVGGKGFAIGAAAADFDGDGWTDLFVTNYGVNALYRNNRDGTFTDVTQKAGLGAPGLWTSAVWFDYDGDGRPDLFVGHFVKYNKNLERDCQEKGVPHYCYPLSYDPWPSKLYHNNGDGTFTDVSESSGIGKAWGKTFGAVATDIDNDGKLDLFVANDSVSNFLFHNLGNGRFEEIGLSAGVGYSEDGTARSGMGVDAGDFDGDGWQDLFVSNFNRERFSIYRNRRNRTFVDEAGRTGIGMATQMYSGWGVRFFDFDSDGKLDLMVCNGHPDDLIESISTTLLYREPMLLFRNTGTGFENVSAGAGAAFQARYPARGLAIGDLDNDGYPDAVVANNGEAPLVLHNTGVNQNHWIGLAGLPAGTWMEWTAGTLKGTRLKTAGGSYLSSQDPRELIGLGKEAVLDSISIRWPSPSRQVDNWQKLAANHYYTLSPGVRPR